MKIILNNVRKLAFIWFSWHTHNERESFNLIYMLLNMNIKLIISCFFRWTRIHIMLYFIKDINFMTLWDFLDCNLYVTLAFIVSRGLYYIIYVIFTHLHTSMCACFWGGKESHENALRSVFKALWFRICCFVNALKMLSHHDS